MPPLSLQITGRASAWLRRRSRELGISPAALVADLVARHEASESLQALSEKASAHARARGLTPETLTELLDGETYE